MAYAFYKIQAGKESSHGTACAATAKWMCYTLHPTVGDLSWVQPEEERGSLAAFFRAYAPQRQAELGDLEGDATFEDILYPLLMAVKGGVTPTQPDGTTNTYLWTFSPDLTSGNDPDTFTVEWGDDVQAWESEYVFATSLTISGALGEAWKVAASLVGRQHTATTFTAGLSDRTVESCLMNLTKLYIDDSGGSIGSTQITGAFVDFEWRLPVHFVPFFTADGNKYFTTHSEKKMAPELDLTLVLDNTTKTLLTTKYTAGTGQLVRIAGIGSTIEGGYTKYIHIDGAYHINGIDELGESEGKTVVAMHLLGIYDSDWGKLFEIAVQNSVSTLP